MIMTKTKIVVLDGSTLASDDNPWTALEALGEVMIFDQTPPELIVERSRGAQVLIVNKVVLTRQDIERLPDLRFIAVSATGYNTVDVKAAGERGIPVANVPVYGTDSVAQFAFAHLLNLCHKVGLHDRLVQGGEWACVPDFCFWRTPQIELAGLTIGIIGFGRIGRRVGEMAHAFGMKVIAYDECRGAEPAYQPFAWKESMADLTAEADVLTLHCPQTEANKGFVNAALLRRMKPGAFLINVARGGLVNEADLARALNEGWIAGASVDVVSEEPIRPGNPLLGARNCVITPHMAWASLAARRRLMDVTIDNVAAFLTGQPQNIVNQILD
jgi:glycerate dehydrogenase